MTNFSKLLRSLLEQFSGRSFIVITICVMLTIFVGFLNYAADHEMHLFLFYLIPIAISAWFAGIWAARLFCTVVRCDLALCRYPVKPSTILMDCRVVECRDSRSHFFTCGIGHFRYQESVRPET